MGGLRLPPVTSRIKLVGIGVQLSSIRMKPAPIAPKISLQLVHHSLRALRRVARLRHLTNRMERVSHGMGAGEDKASPG